MLRTFQRSRLSGPLWITPSLSVAHVPAHATNAPPLPLIALSVTVTPSRLAQTFMAALGVGFS